jgi:hypothetical protein
MEKSRIVLECGEDNAWRNCAAGGELSDATSNATRRTPAHDTRATSNDPLSVSRHDPRSGCPTARLSYQERLELDLVRSMVRKVPS